MKLLLLFSTLVILALATGLTGEGELAIRDGRSPQSPSEEILLVISVDGKLQAINKDSGELKWTSNLDFPMIGSREESANEVKKDFFIPLIDGSLIRFDQDEVNGIGYLEKTPFNMRDARFVEAISKD